MSAASKRRTCVFEIGSGSQNGSDMISWPRHTRRSSAKPATNTSLGTCSSTSVQVTTSNESSSNWRSAMSPSDFVTLGSSSVYFLNRTLSIPTTEPNLPDRASTLRNCPAPTPTSSTSPPGRSTSATYDTRRQSSRWYHPPGSAGGSPNCAS